MKRYYVNIDSPYRHIVFLCCPSVLVVNLNAPRERVQRVSFDNSRLPEWVIRKLLE